MRLIIGILKIMHFKFELIRWISKRKMQVDFKIRRYLSGHQ